MATRIYFPSTGAAEVAPANATWDKVTGAASALKAVRTRISSAMATVTNVKDATTLHTTLIRQYVTEPMAAQTITGTVSGFIRCIESNAAFSAGVSLSVRACSQDGATIRSPVMLAISNSDLISGSPGAQEMATSLSSRSFMDVSENTAISLTSCTLSDGDRLVIEIGFQSADTSTTRTGGISCGDDSATDISASGSATANNPWVEFSQTLDFNRTRPLTSSGLTGSLQAATAEDSRSSSGEAATAATTAPSASLAKALTGPDAAVASVGTVVVFTNDITRPVTGETATAAPGDAGVALALAASGSQAAGSADQVGNLAGLAVSGFEAASATASEFPDLQTDATGATATGQSESPASDAVSALTSGPLAAAVGTLAATGGGSQSESLMGAAATSSAGDLEPSVEYVAALSGEIATGEASSAEPAGEVAVQAGLEGVAVAGNVLASSGLPPVFDPDNQNIWREAHRGLRWAEADRPKAWKEATRSKIWKAKAK